MVFPFVGGLGGRDITPGAIERMINTAAEEKSPEKDIYWLDLKE
jgi:pyruvate/2-oxoacid:ferredoxin oxidoreductase alpha subunit